MHMYAFTCPACLIIRQPQPLTMTSGQQGIGCHVRGVTCLCSGYLSIQAVLKKTSMSRLSLSSEGPPNLELDDSSIAVQSLQTVAPYSLGVARLGLERDMKPCDKCLIPLPSETYCCRNKGQHPLFDRNKALMDTRVVLREAPNATAM